MLTPLRLLLVDDDDGIRERVHRLLRSELPGCVVVETGSAEAALAQVEAGTWDAVILDIRLPGKSGLDILPALRAGRPDLAIIAMSGLPAQPYAAAAGKAGASAYVQKERAPEELIPTLLRLLGRA